MQLKLDSLNKGEEEWVSQTKAVVTYNNDFFISYLEANKEAKPGRIL